MGRGEIGFLHRRWRNQRLEIADARVEFLPDGYAGTIGVSKFGEVGPIALHGSGELQLLGVERRPRHSYRQSKEILKLGSAGRGVRNAQEFTDASGSDRAADGTAEGEDQWFLFLRMNDKRHRAKSDGGEENYWKQDELLRMTRLHCFLSHRGTHGVRSARGVPPITHVRAQGQNCECLYHYLVTVN